MFLFQCSYHTIFSTKCKRQIALPYIYKFRPYISKIWHIFAKKFLDKKYLKNKKEASFCSKPWYTMLVKSNSKIHQGCRLLQSQQPSKNGRMHYAIKFSRV